MDIINIKISELKPYENNAKIHTAEQIEQICKSIEEFGMNDPLGIWGEDNLVVEGHGRLLALKSMGVQDVPCIRLDHLTDDQRKAYTLAHNKLTMNTDFDFDLLETELQDIEIDMTDFGFEFDVAEETKINRKDLSNNIDEVLEIIIKVNSEEELEYIYNELKERGLECRISTL